MGSLTLKFDSTEQVQLVAGFVESVFNMCNESSLNTIKSLNDKLESMDSETMLSVDLTKHEANCLNSMCVILSCIGADSIIAGCNVSSKIARLITAKSDVPRFLAMLKDNHIPAEHCVGLFSSWCSNEGTAILAEKCMEIQSAFNIDMTAVWEWVYNNKCSMDTDWTKEVDIFKEAING